MASEAVVLVLVLVLDALALFPLLGCARAVPVRGRFSKGGAGPKEEEAAADEAFFLVACC